MASIPLTEIGILGVVVAILYTLVRFEVGRRTNSHSSNCEAYRREMQERLARLEEKMKHIADSDLPANKARVEELHDEILVIRGEVWAMKEH